MTQELQNWLLVGLCTLIGAAALWVAGKFAAYVNAHVPKPYATAIARVAYAAGDAVKYVAQTTKASAFDEAGKLKPDAAQLMKASAIGAVRNYLGPKGISEVMRALGYEASVQLDNLIGQHVEVAVADRKALKAAGVADVSPARASIPPPPAGAPLAPGSVLVGAAGTIPGPP